MEDVELLALGVLCATALWCVEGRCPMPVRVLLGSGIVAIAGAVLYLSHISIMANPMDFLQMDVGVFLGVGAMDRQFENRYR